LPGYGQQGFTRRLDSSIEGEPFRIVTAIWLLDDFTGENGATRVVPGTHHLLTQPPKSFADPASRHPDQKIIVAKAGSVLVFNGTPLAQRNGKQIKSFAACVAVFVRWPRRGSLSRIKVDAPDACRRLLATFCAFEL